MTADDRKKLGQSGEKMAVKYLRKKGYRILEQNYRNRLGEIDIIARQRKTIVFVEVKTRRDTRFGDPKWSVTPKKQQRISMVALQYLKERDMNGLPARFDVVSIVHPHGGKGTIELVRNAFELAYT